MHSHETTMRQRLIAAVFVSSNNLLLEDLDEPSSE